MNTNASAPELNEEYEYGKPITRIAADEIITKHNDIMIDVRQKLTGFFRSMSPEMQKSEAERFILSGYNGYIFSKKLVQRFFEKDDSGEKAEYLVVLVGAHPKDDGEFKKGEPTVLLVGCNKHEEKGVVKFKSLNLALPADEHPPHQFFPELPFVREPNVLNFILKK